MEMDARTFGPYQIVRRLGVGGMAETFLALRRGLHGVEQRVCLKRVLPAFAADPSFLRQFQREASIASTLRHTSIVSVVEFGDVEGTQYLALELIDGVDLRDYLMSRPGRVLPPALVARLALDLGYALRYAHGPDHGVVHRDVSPANVMLSRTGEIKLTDFGVARVMSSAAPTTTTGVRGKIAYMSPEQIRGDELDGRADLFSLGVLLFECLCGQRPFHGAHEVETMRRIGVGERPHVRTLAPADTSATLLDAIEGLLQVDREQRTPSATALIEQLSPLPGLHQARRRLAQQVDELRGGIETREHVAVRRDEVGDTRLDHVPAMTLALATESPVRASDTVLLAPEVPAPRPAAHETTPARRRGVGLALGLGALSALLVGGAWLANSLTTGSVGGALQATAPLASPPSAATPTGAPSSVPAVVPAGPGTQAAPPTGRAPAAPASGTPGGLPRAGATAASPPAATTAPSSPESAAVDTPVPSTAPEVPVPADTADTTEDVEAPVAVEPAEGEDLRPGTLRVTVVPWGDVWVDGRYMGRAPTEVPLRPGRHTVAAGTDRPSVRRSVQILPGQPRRVELELTP